MTVSLVDEVVDTSIVFSWRCEKVGEDWANDVAIVLAISPVEADSIDVTLFGAVWGRDAIASTAILIELSSSLSLSISLFSALDRSVVRDSPYRLLAPQVSWFFLEGWEERILVTPIL